MPDEQNDGAYPRMLTVADDDRRARGQCRHPHHLEEASPLAQMDTPTNACARPRPPAARERYVKQPL